MHQHPLGTQWVLAFFGVRPKCCRDAHRQMSKMMGRTLTRTEFESFEDAMRNKWHGGQVYGILFEGGRAKAGPPVPPGQIWDVEAGHALVQLDEVEPNIFKYGTRDLGTGQRDTPPAIRIGADNAIEQRRLGLS